MEPGTHGLGMRLGTQGLGMRLGDFGMHVTSLHSVPDSVKKKKLSDMEIEIWE